MPQRATIANMKLIVLKDAVSLKTFLLRCRALLVFILCSPSVLFAVASEKPNVILIYADDLGYGDTGCYGATQIKTPEVDRLASDGIRFTSAYATHATCTPSRYSILTGQYAWRQKGTGILPGDARLIVPTDKISLGKLFQKAGYKTAVVGKWHLGLGLEGGPDWNGEIKPGPNEVGFDYSFIFPATADRVPTIYVKNHQAVGLDPKDPIQVNYKEKIGTEPTGKENPELLKMAATKNHGHDGTIVNGIGRIGWMTGGHAARWTDESLAGDFTSEAEVFIEENQNQPFFMFFPLNDIHVPRMPGTRFKGASGLGYRGDSILQLDHIVGRINRKLEDLGIKNNTIVMISSDNGPVVNDGYEDDAITKLNGHRPAGKLRGGKYSIFEAGTRVPLILSWPDRVKPGVSHALVSQVDFLASFAKLLNQALPVGEGTDSQDMLMALLGESPTGRNEVIISAKTHALIRGDWKYIEPSDGPALAKNVNIETGLSPEPQLFNLKDDISEQFNLAAQHPDRVKIMSDDLAAALKQSGR